MTRRWSGLQEVQFTWSRGQRRTPVLSVRVWSPRSLFGRFVVYILHGAGSYCAVLSSLTSSREIWYVQYAALRQPAS